MLDSSSLPESSSLDGTGDRACTGDGAELVCKHGPAVGGDIVTAILVDDCGGLGGGVDAPFVGQPAAIQRISAEQTHGCDQNDDQRIHFFYLFPFFHTGNGRSRTAVPKSRAGETARRGEKSLRPHERQRHKNASHLPRRRRPNGASAPVVLRGTTSFAAFGSSRLRVQAFLPPIRRPVTWAERPCTTAASGFAQAARR